TETVANSCPFALSAIPVTPARWPPRGPTHRPLDVCHTHTVPSPAPLAASCPSALSARLQISAVWPSRLARQRPLLVSHSRSTRPRAPLHAASRPSALTAIPHTSP